MEKKQLKIEQWTSARKKKKKKKRTEKVNTDTKIEEINEFMIMILLQFTDK